MNENNLYGGGGGSSDILPIEYCKRVIETLSDDYIKPEVKTIKPNQKKVDKKKELFPIWLAVSFYLICSLTYNLAGMR